MSETDSVKIGNEDLFEFIRSLISEGRSTEFRVSGRSMMPFMVSGRDKVLLSPCNPREIRKGDIILARESRGLIVLHRVIGVDEHGITLRGDGNWHDYEIEKVDFDNVVGVVTEVIRNGRSISVHALSWRVLSYVWHLCYPIRHFLLRVVRFLGV